MIKYVTRRALSNKKYDKYMKIIDEYIGEGGAFDADMIFDFAHTLIILNKKEEAMTILKNFSKLQHNDYIKSKISLYMMWCFKPKDAEKVLLSKSCLTAPDYYELGKIYLLMGNIAKAKEAFTTSLKYSQRAKKIEKNRDRLKGIENHIVKNAFIEIEYDCFIENGGVLEPGHIVFLKHGLELKNEIDEMASEISRNRPYLIWRIDGDTVYTFPITKKPVYTSRHYLDARYYPNSGINRYIKKNVGITSTDNILSIKDKVPANEVLEIMKDIYHDSFENSTSFERSERLTFLKYYVGQVELNDVIEYLDIVTKTFKKLFIIDVNESGYKALEIDSETGELRKSMSFISIDDASIYKVRKLSLEEKNRLLNMSLKKVGSIDKRFEKKKNI